MNVTYRPIAHDWPGERTRNRTASPFKAGWSQTLELLDRELHQLGASRVIFQIDLEEKDIRLDGMPRANARPAFQGVIISFESRYGSLRYFTDRFDSWQANVRAIALGLEALRKVDRYGITRRGEQYTGWKAIESGMGKSAAEALIESYGGRRAALKATHPDRGGDPDEFRRVQEALRIIGGEA